MLDKSAISCTRPTVKVYLDSKKDGFFAEEEWNWGVRRVA